jgi:asparagine synthase (glutamine-hydrolysing)
MAADYRRYDGLPLAERCQYLDLMNYLPEDILVKVDRASMAHSLEVRCPILDHEFAELAARIPLGMKYSRLKGKRILKKLAYRHVPREILDRPKMGFGVPLAAWFKGELEGALQEMVADAGSPMWRYYDRDLAARRVREHVDHKVDWNYGLWRLLFFHRWAGAHLT